MSKNKSLLDKYDLSSVTAVFTGAAPLGAETAEDLHNQWPRWNILQLYGATHVSKWHPLAVAHAFTGLTETGPVVCATAENDICYGSSGALLPMIEARLMSPEGNEITAYDKPGELVVRSPSVALGYLNNEISSKKTFRDGWMWTGDEAVVRKSPNGNEHVWIVDRIKELIKVKVCHFSLYTYHTGTLMFISLGSPSSPCRIRSPPPYSSCGCRCSRNLHP